jgi:hypothetical protein
VKPEALANSVEGESWSMCGEEQSLRRKPKQGGVSRASWNRGERGRA